MVGVPVRSSHSVVPGGPSGPVWPVAPRWHRVAPVAPVAPAGPSGPSGPAGPVTASRRKPRDVRGQLLNLHSRVGVDRQQPIVAGAVLQMDRDRVGIVAALEQCIVEAVEDDAVAIQRISRKRVAIDRVIDRPPRRT